MALDFEERPDGALKMIQVDQQATADNGAIKGNIGASCELHSRELLWEFKCQECKVTYETPVPSGPKEESRMRCPFCDSAKIKRINIIKLSEAKCAG